VINAHHIEMAERHLAGAAQITSGAAEIEGVLFSKAQVDQAAFEKFLQHHWQTLHARLPDLDPRLEPFMNTHLRHFFLIGAMAERERKQGGA